MAIEKFINSCAFELAVKYGEEKKSRVVIVAVYIISIIVL